MTFGMLLALLQGRNIAFRRLPALLLAGCLTSLLPLTMASCRRQPARPLELTLSIVKNELKPHDALWYRLAMRNLGVKEVFVGDEFWFDQHALADNQNRKLDTFFEVIGPGGKAVDSDSGEFGSHGEFDFWTNPPSKGPIQLQPGNSLVASPSIIAPIRAENRADLRRGPEGRQREYLDALRSRQNEGLGKDAPEWMRIPFERPGWAPTDARILTGFDFKDPGTYRIRAVYAPIHPQAAIREIESGRLWLGGLPPETRVFRFESPWMEFTVRP